MQVSGGSNLPYEGASDVQLPDIMSACLRTEDTLCNASMSTRPMVNTKAVSELDRERERKNDLLLDYQWYIEQPGEETVENGAVNFVRDGQMTGIVRWIKEHRKDMYVRDWSGIPAGREPRQHFKEIVEKVFSPGSWLELEGSEGWDWLVTQGKLELLVRFYTKEDGDVEMQVEAEVESYCGPRVVLYDYEDVLAPYWSQNLQPPGPSNPHGAPHVIFVDYPTKDEIYRLVESGFYDLVTEKELSGIEDVGDWTDSDREIARARGSIRGNDITDLAETPEDHKQLRRLICYDVWEGLDVVWTVLCSDKPHLLRARPLGEVSPGIPPMRNIFHTVMIPVQGTWIGMGLPELMESMHDFQVEWFNVMNDAANFEIYPIISYDPSSNLKPEELRQSLAPNTCIPVRNPGQSLVFNRLSPQSGAVGANMISMGQSYNESLTSIGDLQMGKIPTGKSSALRTSGGVQQVLAQGEARPERILRRFFKGITQAHALMHRLNQHFLPDEKKFRVIDVSEPNEDPFISVQRHEDLKDFRFSFHANVLNSSKAALQQSLNEILMLGSNPLFLQLGISTPETLYRTAADYYRALGQMPEKYLHEPTPGASDTPILATEALSMIMRDQMPKGAPAEGDFDAHLQAFSAALQLADEQGPLIDTLSDQQKQMVAIYVQQVQQQKIAAEQQAQMLAAAQAGQAQMQQQGQGGKPGAGGTAKPETPMVNKNETLDESVPSSGTPQ